MGARRVTWLWVATVILACAALYLVGNSRVALWDRDEPRYALAARWMAQTGDWVVPRFGWGEDPTMPRTAKPAGIYWAQAASIKLLDDTEFAVRLPSAIATTLLLTTLALVIGRTFGPARAFWTVLILGTSAMLVAASKMCLTDALLLLFVTTGQLSLFSLYRLPFSRPACGARPGPQELLRLPSNRSLPLAITFWTSLALGGLVKGPVVLGIYATTLLTLYLLDLSRPRPSFYPPSSILHPRLLPLRWWLHLRPLTGLLILSAIVGPWLVMVERRSPGFLRTAIHQDVLQRMKTAMEEHSGPPGFYLATLFGTFFPWSLLLPLSFIIAARRWRRRKDIRFALAAIIGPWILMELVRTKLVHYVLPIFPPLAHLATEAILRCLRNRHDGLTSNVARWGTSLWSLLVLLASLAPIALVISIKGAPGLEGAAILAFIGLIMAAVVAHSFWIHQPHVGLVSMGVGFALFVAAAFAFMLPHASFMRLPVQIGHRLVELGATQEHDVVMTGYKERSLAWYQGGTIDEVWANYFTTHDPATWPTWFVLTPKVLADNPPEVSTRLQRVATFHGLNYAGGKWMEVWIMKKKNPDPEPN